MTHIKNQFRTLVANSELSEKEQQEILETFDAMSEPHKIIFVSLVKDDPSRLPVAIEFLKTFSTPAELTSAQCDAFIKERANT